MRRVGLSRERLATGLVGLLLAVGIALAAAGVYQALRSPAVRVEERVEATEVLSVRVRWEWAVRVPEGNAAWPPGTVLGSDRPLYPFVGGTTLEAVPVIEIRDPSGGGVEGTMRYMAVLRATKDGAAIWDRTVAVRETAFRVPPTPETGTYRGEPIVVVMADQKRVLDEVNRALDLLDRYEGDLLLQMVVSVRGASGATKVELADPVRIHADGFSLPPPETWEREEKVVRDQTVTATVPYPPSERLLDQASWFAGAAAAVICSALVLRRRKMAIWDPDHRRYRAWIVGGRVAVPDDAHTVEVESLRALVAIAQEAGCRVIHDPRVGYVVADRGVYYRFRPGGGPRLGDLLVRQGVIVRADVEEAGRRQAALRRPLGECLVALGLADEVAVHAALAYQRGLVYLEPDEYERSRPARLPVPAAVLGHRPDGRLVVAVVDSSTPAQLLAEALGEPVHLVVTRPGALTGAGEQPAGEGEVTLGRAPVRVLREKGLTLGVLLHACGWIPDGDTAVLGMDDHAVYRHLLRRGDVHPDALHLAAVLAARVRAGSLPEPVDLLRDTFRIPDAAVQEVRDQADEDLVRWYYVSKGTLRRVRRLLAAARACMDVLGAGPPAAR